MDFPEAGEYAKEYIPSAKGVSSRTFLEDY
jgi:hypothetical protein